MFYSIPFDSPTGERLADYYRKIEEANKAAVDYVSRLLEPYPDLLADYHIDFADDCEGGGMIAFSIPAIGFDQETHGAELTREQSVLPYDLFRSFYMEGRIVCYPRISTQIHFIRYGEAVRLYNEGNKHWDFECQYRKVPSKTGYNKPGNDRLAVKIYKYGEKSCRLMMTPADKAAISGRKGCAPNDSTRLARGKEYVWEFFDAQDEDITASYLSGIDPTEREERFVRALETYKEWNRLPSVASGTLPLLLNLHVPSTVDGHAVQRADIAALSYLHWHIDTEGKRYLFSTGMVSDNADMTADPSVSSFFPSDK